MSLHAVMGPLCPLSLKGTGGPYVEGVLTTPAHSPPHTTRHSTFIASLFPNTLHIPHPHTITHTSQCSTSTPTQTTAPSPTPPAHLHRPLSFTTSQTIISVSCIRVNQSNHTEGRERCSLALDPETNRVPVWSYIKHVTPLLCPLTKFGKGIFFFFWVGGAVTMTTKTQTHTLKVTLV